MRRWIFMGIVLVAVLLGVARWSQDFPSGALGSKLPPATLAESPSPPPAQLESFSRPLPAAVRVEAAEVTVADVEERAEAAPPAVERPLPRGPVALFEHADHDARSFDGGRWLLYVGLTDAGVLFADDEASRVEVPDGLQVTLFDDVGGRGASIVLGPGAHNLEPYGFNDRASSALVAREGSVDRTRAGPRGVVQLHEHGRDSGEPGRHWSLPLRAEQATRLFRARDADFDDNSASVAWVPPGFELTLFDDASGRGRAMVLGPGFHDLAGLGWNDRTSSARVRRLEPE